MFELYREKPSCVSYLLMISILYTFFDDCIFCELDVDCRTSMHIFLKIKDEQQASSRCASKLNWWSAFHWKYFISNNLRHCKRQRWTSRVYRKGSQGAWRYSSSCSTWCKPVKMNKSCFDFLWIWQERIVFHCFCDEILTYWSNIY